MGVPGRVTDVPGLTRSEQLQRIGNGAMPQQAYAAYEHLLDQMKEAA
jgi:DNA (cytosine-5)-methyltransferase 1